MRRNLTLLEVCIILLLFLLLVSMCGGGWVCGLDIVFYLVVGWFQFLGRVLPQVHMRWDLVGSGVVYVAVLIVGAHFFIRWIYREMGPQGTSEAPVGPRVWKWRWTMAGFTLVVLMFAAGTAMVGLVHQTGWLVTGPRIYRTGHERANRVKCASNLRQIGQAMFLWAESHGGKAPDDLSVMITDCDLSPEVFVCPSSTQEKAVGKTPQEIAENAVKPEHCSYIYLGKGLVEPFREDQVVAIEPLQNHGEEGMNVLYGDGRADWLDKAAAEKLLGELEAKERAAATQPTSAPSRQ